MIYVLLNHVWNGHTVETDEENKDVCISWFKSCELN